MDLVYKCNYDGKICDKVKVNVVDGKIIRPSNEEIKKRYHGKIAEDILNHSWDICDSCRRNYSMSCCCNGYIEFADK